MPSSGPLEEDSSPIPWSPSPPRRTLALKESIALIPSCSTRLRDITIALSESRAAIQNPALPENPPSIAQNMSNAHAGIPLSMTPTHVLALELAGKYKIYSYSWWSMCVTYVLMSVFMFHLNLIISPVSGKTCLLQRIIQCLHSRYPRPGLVVHWYGLVYLLCQALNLIYPLAQSACRLGGVVFQEFIGRFSNGADHCAVASSLSRSLDTKHRLDECHVLVIDDSEHISTHAPSTYIRL